RGIGPCSGFSGSPGLSPNSALGCPGDSWGFSAYPSDPLLGAKLRVLIEPGSQFLPILQAAAAPELLQILERDDADVMAHPVPGRGLLAANVRGLVHHVLDVIDGLHDEAAV